MDKELKSNHAAMKAELLEKYYSEGFDNFSEKEILCLLMAFGEPSDAENIAGNMLRTHGNIGNVLLSNPQYLMKSFGIGEGAAAIMKIIPELSYIKCLDDKDNIILGSSYHAKLYFSHLFAEAKYEEFAAAAVDDSLRLTANPLHVRKGTSSSITLSYSDIASYAIKYKSKKIFIAHCHPDGSCKSSAEDIASTRELTASLATLNIKVVDHIITGNDTIYSMRSEGIADFFSSGDSYICS